MPDNTLDLNALLGSVDPGPDKRAEAMRRLGTMFVMSGARGISDAGARLLGEADKRREIGLDAPERATRLLGARRAASEIQAEQDPAYRRALLGAVSRGAPGLADESTPTQALRLLVPFSQKAEEREVERAETARRARLDAERAELDRARLGLERERVQQDAYAAVADPVTGRVVVYNKKTGEERQLPPVQTPGGQGTGAPGTRPLPGVPGKPTESQRKAVLGKSESVAKLDLAIDALSRAPGAYGGAGNFAAAMTEGVFGTPAQSLLSRRYSPDELRAKNQISNVVSAIINERAGANVTYREELRQKFLPQDYDSHDQALQKLKDLRDSEVESYRAQGGGLVPEPSPRKRADAEPPALPRKAVGGKTYEKRADGWYEVD
jgi:hypothetical protein